MNPYKLTHKDVGLTLKQHKFSQIYASTGDRIKAYKETYDTKSDNRNYLSKKAYDVLEDDDVRFYIRELKEFDCIKYQIDKKKITDMYLETYQMAKEGRETSVMSSTAERIAKLYDLIDQKERLEVNLVNDKRETMVQRFLDNNKDLIEGSFKNLT